MSNEIEIPKFRGKEDIPSVFKLPLDLASEAMAVIRGRKHDKAGSYETNGIWLFGDNRDFYIEGFARELEVAKSLRDGGVNVPKVYGLHIPEDESSLPFLVMERLNISEFDQLNPREQVEARSKYDEQIERAKYLGFNPNDTTHRRNSGFDREKQEMFLFDFEDWDRRDKAE
jgi:hypothetical protein